jgi:hypothetical protein
MNETHIELWITSDRIKLSDHGVKPLFCDAIAIENNNVGGMQVKRVCLRGKRCAAKQ